MDFDYPERRPGGPRRNPTLENQMQAWDQVKVIVDGPFKDQAGLVVRSDAKAEIASVKLDTTGEVVNFGFAELQLLGR